MNLFLALAVLEWTPGETQVSSCNVTKHCYVGPVCGACTFLFDCATISISISY